MIRSGINIAETKDERNAVYRFRYQVYVEEMGRYRQTADHDNRMFYEPEDEYSRIGYAAENGEIVATARSTWGGLAPFPERQIRQYGLEPFLAEMKPEQIAVGERGMVARHLRGTDLLFRMISQGATFANENRIQLGFGACEPHLLNLYLGFGHRTYSKRNWNSAEAGYLIPLVFVTEDVEYLRQIRSPLRKYYRDFGADARIPDVIKRVLAEGSAVTSRRFTSDVAYWSEVHGALSGLEGKRVSALDGLSEQDAVRCLGKSSIIECNAGDRVLKKGGVARNMFVVLEGTLEARDGDRVARVMSAGDIFGELAFLLDCPRTMDVYAATDGVRVLSLSETTIRDMIESDAPVAASLLLNISKMLCLRLVQNG